MSRAQAPVSIPVLQGEIDALAPGRYKLDSLIGRGSYGLVIKAHDLVLDKPVAIKKVLKEIFHDQLLSKRILREIRLLAHFEHENIIGLRNLLAPRPFSEVFIVMDVMATDLKAILRSRQTLSDSHIQYFTYQILCALKCIHSANVMHRDLTPSNVLLDTNCDLKLCDFGLARENRQPDQAWQLWTDYVTTRWYRAPELVMEDKKYTTAIDVWSLGCIFAEMLVGRTIFPGRDRINQLDRIMQVLGTPSEEDITGIGSPEAHTYIARREKLPRVPWRSIVPPEVKDDAVDLLDKMLQFNPAKRITVDEALAHPYFAELHDPDDEVVSKTSFRFPDAEIYDNTKITQMILEECEEFQRKESARLAANKAGSQGLSIGAAGAAGHRTQTDGSVGWGVSQYIWVMDGWLVGVMHLARSLQTSFSLSFFPKHPLDPSLADVLARSLSHACSLLPLPPSSTHPAPPQHVLRRTRWRGRRNDRVRWVAAWPSDHHHNCRLDPNGATLTTTTTTTTPIAQHAAPLPRAATQRLCQLDRVMVCGVDDGALWPCSPLCTVTLADRAPCPPPLLRR